MLWRLQGGKRALLQVGFVLFKLEFELWRWDFPKDICLGYF